MEEKRKPLAQLVSTRLGLIGFGVVGGTWTSNQNCSGLDFLHLTRKLAPNQGWSWTANYLGGCPLIHGMPLNPPLLQFNSLNLHLWQSPTGSSTHHTKKAVKIDCSQ